MYQLRILPAALKELNKLDKKTHERVLITLAKVKQNPYIGKKMDGRRKNQYVVRVWPYRVVYEISNNLLVVLVIKIAHRQSVYKGL